MEPGMPTRREPEDDTDAAFWNRAARAYSRSAIKDPAGYERTLSSTLDLLSAGIGFWSSAAEPARQRCGWRLRSATSPGRTSRTR